MHKIVVILGVLVIAALGYLHYDSQQQLRESRQQLFELRIEIEELKQQVSALDKQVKTLDESSVQGIVREANSAILDGWQSLVNSVETEIRKARESLQTDQQAPAPQQ